MFRGFCILRRYCVWISAFTRTPRQIDSGYLGARTRNRLEEALGALSINLSPDDIRAIERTVPKGAAAGARYAAPQMIDLDSERG